MFNRKQLCIATFAIFLLSTSTAFALPIDWNGSFGVDATLIDTYRRIEANGDNSGVNGTQEPPLAAGNHANASWQSYVFRLQPNIIINDAATLKGEFTSGYGRGGHLGENTTQNRQGTFANALYSHNTSDSNDSIVINQLYMELYSDLATYQIGRHSFDWGLGAVYNDGDQLWDRHFTLRDGVTMNLKLGNFFIKPYWSKVTQGSSFTRATNVKEWGISLLYDNPERDLAFGILYGLKQNNSFNGSLQQDVDGDGSNSNLGQTDVTITDIYFKKAFGKFDASLEVPLFSGEIGQLYDSGNTKYKARAYLFEGNWRPSENWTVGFDAGRVSGDSGVQSSFDAMYLHPNYQVADILFSHNLSAVSSPNQQSIYDSYITNANYFKLRGSFQVNKWTLDAAVIYAQADETAKAGEAAFNHQDNQLITNSNTDQADDLGTEFDLGFTYQWNNEVSVGGAAAYLMTGDYYKYTNSTTVQNNADNTYLLQARVGMEF